MSAAGMRRWRAAGRDDPFAGRAELSVQVVGAVLAGLGRFGQRCGVQVAVGVRSLGLAAGVSHDTAAAVLRYLREQPDPFVVLLAPAAGMRGDCYELRIPDRWLRAAYRGGWVGGAVPVPHPVFRARGRLGGGLGLAAGAVYAVLTGTPAAGPAGRGGGPGGRGASAAGPPRRARFGLPGAGRVDSGRRRPGPGRRPARDRRVPGRCCAPATGPTGPPITRCAGGSPTGGGRPRRADPTTSLTCRSARTRWPTQAVDAAVALIRHVLGGVVVEDLAA